MKEAQVVVLTAFMLFGFARPADAMPIAAPRQLAPWSTSHVTSRRPTFRWEPAAGLRGGVVEICADRACGTVLDTIVEHSKDRAEAHFDLPPGNAYWRVKGLSHGQVGTASSPVWPFVVGARTAHKREGAHCDCSHDGKQESPASTSWGSTLDLDGDGYADVVIGRDDGDTVFHPTVYVYRGGPSGVSSSPSVTLHDPLSPNAGFFGFSVASLGDVNGDGFADMVVGSEAAVNIANQNYGAVYIYFGRPGGIQSTPDQTLLAPLSFGITVAGAGDINGDGYADLAVPLDNGSMNIYLGSSTGVATTPSMILSVPSYDAVLGVDGAADVNGDGFGDIIASAFLGGGIGRVFVFLGGPSGPSPTPDVTITGASDSFLFGEFVVNAGDVDGDGFTDIATNWFTFGTSHVAIYHGGPCGLSLTPQTFELALPLDDPGLSALAAIEDADGDGFDDIAVGAASDSMARPGRVYVYRGSATGLITAPAQILEGSPPSSGGSLLGEHLGQLGDVNGDAIADLAAHDGRSVDFYYGSLAGFPATPSLRIDSPHNDPNFGGAIR